MLEAIALIEYKKALARRCCQARANRAGRLRVAMRSIGPPRRGRRFRSSHIGWRPPVPSGCRQTPCQRGRGGRFRGQRYGGKHKQSWQSPAIKGGEQTRLGIALIINANLSHLQYVWCCALRCRPTSAAGCGTRPSARWSHPSHRGGCAGPAGSCPIRTAGGVVRHCAPCSRSKKSRPVGGRG